MALTGHKCLIYNGNRWPVKLKHWGWNKMADILQTTLSNAFPIYIHFFLVLIKISLNVFLKSSNAFPWMLFFFNHNKFSLNSFLGLNQWRQQFSTGSAHDLVLSGNKHYLKQCWQRSKTPCVITKPQWVKLFSCAPPLLEWKYFHFAWYSTSIHSSVSLSCQVSIGLDNGLALIRRQAII